MAATSGSSLLMGAAAAAGGGYEDYDITRSLRFHSGDSAYLKRTFSGGNTQKMTFSCWFKRNVLPGTQRIFWTSADGLYFDGNAIKTHLPGASGSATGSAHLIRDNAAWYHLVMAIDLTGASANDVRVWLNNTLIHNYDVSGANTALNSAQAHYIGIHNDESASKLDAYLSDIHFIDGDVLTPSTFAATDADGIWSPVTTPHPDVTYGTNGFHLAFGEYSSDSDIGNDTSGKNNNWTVTNLKATDSSNPENIDVVADCPVNSTSGGYNDPGGNAQGQGNFATWNVNGMDHFQTLSDGQLTLLGNSSTGNWKHKTYATMGARSGKFYFEYELLAKGADNSTHSSCGVASMDMSARVGYNLSGNGQGGHDPGYEKWSWAYRLIDGVKIWDGTTTSWPSGDQAAVGDTYMIAVDIDAGKIWFGREGNWFTSSGSGNFSTSTPAFEDTRITEWGVIPVMRQYNSSKAAANFGQRPFQHTPPTGFKAWCSCHLPDFGSGATLNRPHKFIDTVFYAGDGNSTRTITGFDFDPDFIWSKELAVNGWQHNLYDRVRGPGGSSQSNNSALHTNSDGAYGYGNSHDHGYLSSFETGGFGITKGSQSSGDYMNHSGWNYVALGWDAGTAHSGANNDGGINISAGNQWVNDTAGFSITQYTGGSNDSTFGHGLSSPPHYVIIKCTSDQTDWAVHTRRLGNGHYLKMNQTSSSTGSTNFWNGGMTDSVVGVKADGKINSSQTFKAYCWRPIGGLVAMGKYKGTDNESYGPFNYCGFAPRMIILKGEFNLDWIMYNTASDPTNAHGKVLFPNKADGEADQQYIDVYSNGWKLRNQSGGSNGAYNYHWIAWADQPLKLARGQF